MERINLGSSLVTLIVTNFTNLNIPPSGFAAEPATFAQDMKSGEQIVTAVGTVTKFVAVITSTVTLNILKGPTLEAWRQQMLTNCNIGSVVFTLDYMPSNALYSYDNAVINSIEFSANGTEPFAKLTLQCETLVNKGIA